MSVQWSGYQPYYPIYLERPQVLPRLSARQEFVRCMETKGARVEMLRGFLAANDVDLSDTEVAVQDLNDWFRLNVEADLEHPGQLSPVWYSVVHDVALFLGERMIKHNPNLYWEFFVWGKSNVAYQRHVIMGFSTEDPKLHTNLDVDRLVSQYAHQIVAHNGSISHYGVVNIRGTDIDVDAIAQRSRKEQPRPDRFLHMLHNADQRA